MLMRSPPEDPRVVGLRPNADIGYLTNQGETLFATMLECSGGSGAAEEAQRTVLSRK